jgi:hypothetical protein
MGNAKENFQNNINLTQEYSKIIIQNIAEEKIKEFLIIN